MKDLLEEMHILSAKNVLKSEIYLSNRIG